ncbi:11355_t:CDS:2 [Paraglomus brasilianum]|uniref:11355_t:CDS:1 n=1 Tax=Paraglomus brasilianum TaxID=144538 RepID=A0A9N9G2H6_9GLOM|nr:11355_t:CDS:2 [Paraglomus brasilianum]
MNVHPESATPTPTPISTARRSFSSAFDKAFIRRSSTKRKPEQKVAERISTKEMSGKPNTTGKTTGKTTISQTKLPSIKSKLAKKPRSKSQPLAQKPILSLRTSLSSIKLSSSSANPTIPSATSTSPTTSFFPFFSSRPSSPVPSLSQRPTSIASEIAEDLQRPQSTPPILNRSPSTPVLRSPIRVTFGFKRRELPTIHDTMNSSSVHSPPTLPAIAFSSLGAEWNADAMMDTESNKTKQGAEEEAEGKEKVSQGQKEELQNSQEGKSLVINEEAVTVEEKDNGSNVDGGENDDHIIAPSSSTAVSKHLSSTSTSSSVYSLPSATASISSPTLSPSLLSPPLVPSSSSSSYSSSPSTPEPHEQLDITAFLAAPRLTQRVRLKSGRVVSFSEVGDRDGFPVFVFLGMGCVRYFIAFFDDLASSYGLRLICPDRPGVGLSDDVSAEDQQILRWPDVIDELCDIIGIKKFFIMAHSAGAPHALTCALKLPHRLQGTIYLVCPWVSTTVANNFKWLRFVPTSIMKLTNTAGISLQQLLYGRSPYAMKPSHRNSGALATPMTSLEKKQRLGLAILKASFAENLSGANNDLVMCFERKYPFGFSYTDVNHPVHVFHGTKDERIPVSAVKWMEENMPDCRLTLIEGGKHSLLLRAEVVDSIFKSIAVQLHVKDECRLCKISSKCWLMDETELERTELLVTRELIGELDDKDVDDCEDDVVNVNNSNQSNSKSILVVPDFSFPSRFRHKDKRQAVYISDASQKSESDSVSGTEIILSPDNEVPKAAEKLVSVYSYF